MALRSANDELILENPPLVNDSDLKEAITALEGSVNLPDTNYSLPSQIPTGYPLGQDFETFHRKLRRAVRYRNTLRESVSELVELEIELKEVDDGLRDVATDPKTAAFWKKYLQYDHLKIILSTKPALSRALSKAKSNRVGLEARLVDHKTNTLNLLDDAKKPAYNVIGNVETIVSQWEKKQSDRIAKTNILSKDQSTDMALVSDLEQQLAQAQQTLKSLQGQRQSLSNKLSGYRNSLRSNQQRLQSVLRQIRKRPARYVCEGAARHTDPLARKGKVYVCNTANTRRIRKLWLNQNAERDATKRAIGSLNRQISQTNSQVNQLTNRISTFDKEVKGKTETLRQLRDATEKRGEELVKLFEAYWGSRNEVKSFEEKKAIAERALSELDQISFDIKF